MCVCSALGRHETAYIYKYTHTPIYMHLRICINQSPCALCNSYTGNRKASIYFIRLNSSNNTLAGLFPYD